MTAAEKSFPQSSAAPSPVVQSGSDPLGTGEAPRARPMFGKQGANIPATLDAERRLHERGILSVPDFIANAGGVICAAVEYHGGTQNGAFEAIGEKIATNTRAVLETARSGKLPPREAAGRLAENRVRAAMELRRWH